MHPQSHLENVSGGHDPAYWEMYFETEIKWTLRRIWRPLWSDSGDALGDQGIEWTQRCTRRLWMSELGDTHGGGDWVISEMHFEVVIERVGWFTWWPWSIKSGGVVGGGCSRSDWSAGGQSGGSQSLGSESRPSDSERGKSGDMCDWSSDSIHWETRNCGNGESWVQQGTQGAEKLAGSGSQLILGWYSSRCMQYSACAVLGVCCTWCMLDVVYTVLGVCCTWYILYLVLSPLHGMER